MMSMVALVLLLKITMASLNNECGEAAGNIGNFMFVTERWNPVYLVASKKDSLAINCSSNDPNATYSLQHMHTTIWESLPYGSLIVVQKGGMFVIPDIADKYSGHYRCIAKVMLYEICLYKGILFPRVNPDHVIVEIQPPSPISVTEGEELQFYCLAEGMGSKDESFLKWYKKTQNGEVQLQDSLIKRDGYIDRRKGYDKDFVIIKQVKKSDAGTYICKRITSPSTSKQVTTEVRVTDRIPPVVTFEPYRREEKILEGKAKGVKVVCKVEKGEPKPRKEWRNPSGEIIHKCDETTDTCSLILKDISYEKSHGNYTCTARNSGGSKSISIFINILVGVELEKSLHMDVAGYEEEGEIICRVKRANPLPTMTWFSQVWSCLGRDCKPIDNQWTKTFSKVSVNPQSSVSTTKSTLIVPPSKITAFYSCRATNGIGHDTHNITLHRLENPPNVFQLAITDRPATENDTFWLNCTATTNLYLEMTWTKNEQILKEEIPRILIKEDVNKKDFLRVKAIKFQMLHLSDSGIYKCIGKMANGTTKSLAYGLDVKAMTPPMIANFTDQTLNQTTKNALLFCNTSGYPLPSISWKFQSTFVYTQASLQNINECDTRKQGFYFVSGKQHNKLVICDLNYKLHEGMYTCIAENKKGTTVARAQVRILSRPSIVTWAKQIEFEPGKLLRLFCEADGNPSPNVTIFRSSADMPVQGLQRYANGTAYASFESDSNTKGQYVCTAKNAFGTSTKYSSVIIQARTAAIYAKSISSSVIAAIVVSCLVFIVIVLFVALLYKRKLDKKFAPYLKPNKYFQIDPDRSLFEQSGDLPYDPDWEFPRDRLNFLKMIGSGAFGEVWLAEAQGILTLEPRDKTSSAAKRRSKIRRSQRYTHIHGREKKKTALPESTAEKTLVAVKTLKGDASDTEYKDLASELKILIHIGENKQIVNLLGACTRGGKLCVVLEYCPNGSLLDFLRERRDVFEPIWLKNEPDMAKELTYIDLTMIAYQIAKGLDFLASKRCVHRDVAARNVLIGVDFIVKVADFGLARDIYKDEFYMKSTSGLLPVKWMAPESLFDKIYTSQSDAWSYGIVLWEVFTLGGSPYPGLPTEDLFGFLEQGRRMDQPELCPLELYAIMNDCWERNPNDRPLFSQIVDRIGQVISNRSGKDNPYLQFESEDGPARDTDYLVPVIKGNSMSDEYISAVPPSDRGSLKKEESPEMPTYLNDDGIRMSLLEEYDSSASNYANTRQYSEGNEVEV